MSKYYVTVRAETVVILEETYIVHADDPVEAEKLVSGGEGEWINDEIIDYGKTLNEYVYSVKSE